MESMDGCGGYTWPLGQAWCRGSAGGSASSCMEGEGKLLERRAQGRRCWLPPRLFDRSAASADDKVRAVPLHHALRAFSKGTFVLTLAARVFSSTSTGFHIAVTATGTCLGYIVSE